MTKHSVPNGQEELRLANLSSSDKVTGLDYITISGRLQTEVVDLRGAVVQNW